MVEQLGVIGCGLMGGSFALALRQAGQVGRVVGYSRSPQARQQALTRGVIDVAANTVAEAVVGSDVVLVAVPVAATEATLREITPHLKPQAWCMDVGSTKGDVVQAARRAMGARVSHFVPAHPIAGKELAGVEHADAQLYGGRLVVLTPQSDTSTSVTEQARALWSSVGGRVEVMSAQAHDSAFAAVSHLPHLLAFAYMKGLMEQAEGEEFLRLAGPGFRDFSRIAGSDSAVWRDILLGNSQAVLQQLTHFRDALDALASQVKAGDGAQLQRIIAEVAQERRAWPSNPSDASSASSDE
jgi:prephenate dehydrogenase